jgi:hypothetical protein
MNKVIKVLSRLAILVAFGLTLGISNPAMAQIKKTSPILLKWML